MTDTITSIENEHRTRHQGSHNRHVASEIYRNHSIDGPIHLADPRMTVRERYAQRSQGFFLARKMLRRRHIMKERKEKREMDERKRRMQKEKQESSHVRLSHGISIAVGNFVCDDHNDDENSSMSFSMI